MTVVEVLQVTFVIDKDANVLVVYYKKALRLKFFSLILQLALVVSRMHVINLQHKNYKFSSQRLTTFLVSLRHFS